MKRVGLVLDDRYKLHKPFEFHPECPDRLDAIKRGIEKNGFLSKCELISPSSIDESWILKNHSPEYVSRFKAAIAYKRYMDSFDCYICPHSFETALLSVGGIFAAIDSVVEGAIDHAFCILRPPGHHAEKDFAMGFCFFNNIALGARYLIEKYGYKKILIFDWDVHHGNGTQHSFETSSNVFYCSFHADPKTLFPCTGYANEIGKKDGYGYTLNVPMLPGSDDQCYRYAFKNVFMPKLKNFEPDFILVSAGFDAHIDDPLGNLCLSTSSYKWMTQEMIRLAKKYCSGKLISVLEGGYNLKALTECTAIHIQTLIDGI